MPERTSYYCKKFSYLAYTTFFNLSSLIMLVTIHTYSFFHLSNPNALNELPNGQAGMSG